MNSPVTASNPTWMVCSKSEGEEISGRCLSIFLPAGQRSRVVSTLQPPRRATPRVKLQPPASTFLRGEHGLDLVPFLLLRHGRQRPRAVIGRLRVLGSSSLAAHPDRGGGGLVLTHSAVTHLTRACTCKEGETQKREAAEQT